MGYKVKLPLFEGPFDLLVYLIENARMDIYDIRVSEITAQYLEYIENMQQMDVSVSSEFMVLAAELIELKSRMLLPRQSADPDQAPPEDPRSELVERLLEYKRYKELAAELGERAEKNALIYEKPQEDISAYLENPDIYLSLTVENFVSAFELFLQKERRVAEVKAHYQRIEREVHARNILLHGHYDSASGKYGVLAEVRVGAVGHNAIDVDVICTHIEHAHARGDIDLSLFTGRPYVVAVDGVHAVQGTLCYHGLGSHYAFLNGLEDELNVAAELVPVLLKYLRRAQQHGDVGVVAAGMHDARGL